MHLLLVAIAFQVPFSTPDSLTWENPDNAFTSNWGIRAPAGCFSSSCSTRPQTGKSQCLSLKGKGRKSRTSGESFSASVPPAHLRQQCDAIAKHLSWRNGTWIVSKYVRCSIILSSVTLRLRPALIWLSSLASYIISHHLDADANDQCPLQGVHYLTKQDPKDTRNKNISNKKWKLNKQFHVQQRQKILLESFAVKWLLWTYSIWSN